MRAAASDYRANWRVMGIIVLVVTVPVAILSNIGVSSTSDTTSAAYLAFAQLAMNAALIWAVIERRHNRPVSVRQAYYTGSAALVRLVLVAVMLVGMSLLMVLGVVILGFGLAAPVAGESLPAGEQVLLALLAILVSIPSIVLLVRAMWAIYIVVETPLGPLEAIRKSRMLTRGKVVVTLSRLVALAVFLLLMVVVPVVVLLVLANLTHSVVFTILLQIFISLLVLPLANFYLYGYYQGLA